MSTAQEHFDFTPQRCRDEECAPTLDERFARFHSANPQVYETLVRLAREAVRAGRAKVGAKMLWERLRWELFTATTGDDEYALDNNYTSRYARLIMEREADLRGVFETRALRTD